MPTETLADAVASFRGDLAIRRSPHTVKAYTTALRHFEAFYTDQGQPADRVPVADATPDMALEFVRWLNSDRELSPSTLHNYLSAIGRFYRWLMLEDKAGFAAADYARLQERLADVRGRRPSRPLPHVPTEDAVQAIVDAAHAVPFPKEPDTAAGRRAHLRRLRDIALVEALRSSGARVGEIVGLCRGDLDHSRHTAIVTGKGQKQRPIYFDDTAWEALTTYLKARLDGVGRKPLASLPLFARHDRGAGTHVLPISTNTARAILDNLVRAAGIEETITPHRLRHRFATGILAATRNLAATQDLLGHASPTTTRIYARLTDEDTAAAHRQARQSGRI